MRILFVNPYYKPYLGGIERLIEKLGDQFLKRDHKVGVLTTHFSFPRRYVKGLKDFEVIDGIEVFRVKSFPKKAPPFFQVPLVWFSPLRIKKIIKQFNPDVIHLMTDKWFGGNFLSFLLAPKKARIIFTLNFHDLTLLKQGLRPINAILTRMANKVQVATKIEKEKVKRAYGTPEEKFVIIPWGVEVEKKPITHYPLPITILCVGRLSKHKGQMWLLELFHSAAKHFTKPTKLVLVGGDEGEGKNLEFKIENLKLEDKVEIAGEISQKELLDWYKKADIFALFPEYEAFGLAFLEAMAAGLPVLTHKVGAIPEVFKKGAVLVEPYNKRQAEKALIKLVNDEKFRLELADEAYRYAKNFSGEKTAEKFLKIYGKPA